MRGSRRERKGGRHEQDLGAARRERPVELRESQVVADRQPERAELGGDGDDLRSRCATVRLPHGNPAGEIDVEEVNLAIVCEQPSGRVEQAARVVCPTLTGDRFQERARAEVHARLARERAHCLARRPGQRFGMCPVLDARAAPGEHLGQHDQGRPARGRLANEGRGARDVRRAVGPGRHLHGGRDETLHLRFERSA